MPSRERFPKGLQADARVAQEGQARLLEGVELAHVQVDEAHGRILEGGLGGGGEVRVAGAHAQHQVGLAGHDVRPRRARDPDRAEGGGIVVGQGALARLGLAHRDPG